LALTPGVLSGHAQKLTTTPLERENSVAESQKKVNSFSLVSGTVYAGY